MKTDLYTKIVFTLIAIALWGILLKPLYISDNVNASSGIVDVNIKQIDGKGVNKAISVNIDRINGRNIKKYALPVEIEH